MLGCFFKSLKHSKSASIDGLPGEFYKLFSRSSAKSANPKTCYVQGSSICQNIRLVQDAIAYAKSVNQTGSLLFMDFEKAFESKECQFI